MDAEKVLLGDSLPLYEVEEDFDRDITEEASLKYDMMSVMNSFGTGDFKSTYMTLMPHIAENSLDIQREFCHEFLIRVQEVYHYTFPINLDFISEYSVSDFYKFLEFTEFDYISFLAKVWKLLPVSLRDVDIASYCESNLKLVISKIDEVLRFEVFSRLVSLFLRTYTKEYLVEFIIEKSTKSRMLIFLEIKEGEENG